MLYCGNNQLTALNLQELTALQDLYCNKNRLTALNLQGLSALQELSYNKNPLTDLNLTGVPAVIKNQHAELERKLLFNQLSQASSIEARQAIIARLGADYTRENCLHYCPVYAANQIDNLASSVLPAFSAYLPSIDASNNAPNAQQKRTRDEEQMQDDNQMEQEEKEPGDEHNAKRRKTS